MADDEALRARVQELAERQWDVPALEARIRKLSKDGIPKKKLDPQEMRANREQILDRVQRHAEEYNFILKNCAQGTALALLGGVRPGQHGDHQGPDALPGYRRHRRDLRRHHRHADRLWTCSSEATTDWTTRRWTGRLPPPRSSSAFFEARARPHLLRRHHRNGVILGHRLNPGESEAAMISFAGEKGFEKCGLPPGLVSGSPPGS